MNKPRRWPGISIFIAAFTLTASAQSVKPPAVETMQFQHHDLFPDFISDLTNRVGNPLQCPCLRIPGAYIDWQALDVHLAEAAAGQLTLDAALEATAVDFDAITIRLGREQQRRSYRASLGLQR